MGSYQINGQDSSSYSNYMPRSNMKGQLKLLNGRQAITSPEDININHGGVGGTGNSHSPQIQTQYR